jgi:hypothetical protein
MADSFIPVHKATVTPTADTTVGGVQQAIMANAPQIRVWNEGAVKVRICWGKGPQTCTTADLALAPGAIEVFTKGDADTIALLTASSSAVVNITPGTGD